MKKAVGTLKGDLSQFRELEAFAAFGSELDKVSQAALDRGYRLVELLKQPLNSPMPVQEQVVSLYAGTNGYLDPVPVEDVPRYERELLEWIRARHGGLLDGIKSSGDIEDMDAFEGALKGFADAVPGQRRQQRRRRADRPAEVVAADAVLDGDDGEADDAGGERASPWPVVPSGSCADASSRCSRPRRSPRRWSSSPPAGSSRPSSGSTRRGPTASRSPR